MDALDDPPGECPRPSCGVERPDDAVPQTGGLMHGDDDVELRRVSWTGLRRHEEEHVYALGVEGVPIAADGVLE